MGRGWLCRRGAGLDCTLPEPAGRARALNLHCTSKSERVAIRATRAHAAHSMPTTPASPPLALAAVRLLCSVCQVIQSEGNRDTCENQKCQLELAKTGVVYDDNGATRLSRKRGRVAKPSPRANKEPAQPEGPQRKPRLWVDVSDDEAEAASPPPPPPPAFGVGDAVKGRHRATEYTNGRDHRVQPRRHVRHPLRGRRHGGGRPDAVRQAFLRAARLARSRACDALGCFSL